MFFTSGDGVPTVFLSHPSPLCLGQSSCLTYRTKVSEFSSCLESRESLGSCLVCSSLGVREHTVLATTLGNQWGMVPVGPWAGAVGYGCYYQVVLRVSQPFSGIARKGPGTRAHRKGTVLPHPPHFLPRRTAGLVFLRKSLPLEFGF